MMNPPFMPLDLLFYADHGVTLIGNKVQSWHPIHGGKTFLEQVEEGSRPKLTLSGAQHVIAFDGKASHLCFRAFSTDSGPHTFLFVCRYKQGVLLDSQHAGPTVQEEATPWRIVEVVQDTDLPINGDTVLGANYTGKESFLNGEIAAFGYKHGILARAQREYLYRTLEAKLGAAEQAYWIIRIRMPQFYLIRDLILKLKKLKKP